jgi:UDP-N-acetylmuramoyl-L-alanyl-D-glutamate--2,6-diaminopimelate ligase
MQLLTEMMARARIDGAELLGGGKEIYIRDMTVDSRRVQPGDLFIAVPGTKTNGTDFIAEALSYGAAALVLPKDVDAAAAAIVPVLKVPDIRAAVGALAAAFFTRKPRYMLTVTGTDGKTSTVEFARQMAAFMGEKAASIGTLGLRSPIKTLNEVFPKNNTSPEPILLHRTLQALASSGVKYVAIESSSHGLEQKRVDGIKFTAGAFTNISRDHLDYHGTMEAYFAAKARLFNHVLPSGATAILNADDEGTISLRRVCLDRRLSVRTFGRAVSDYQILEATPHPCGLKAKLRLEGREVVIDLPHYGLFQLQNMLTAYGLMRATGAASAQLIPLFEKLQGIHGRLERVAVHPSVAPIFIDYAHTPAALENILKTLRQHTVNHLHVVFGCGGDRDPGKRPEMGSVAVTYADHVIVTDDNPRNESPAKIRAEIMAKAIGAKEIGDRREAIHVAVRQLAKGDVLVVAGKGHETTQIIGNQVLEFDDAAIIKEAVAAL